MCPTHTIRHVGALVAATVAARHPTAWSPPMAADAPVGLTTSKPAKKPVAGKAAKPSKKPAMKKPAAGAVNKSEEVRKLATAMKAKGIKPRPSVIVAELGAKGIKVAAAQVSIVLKKMGFRPLRKRKKNGAAGAVAGAPKAVVGKSGARAAAGAVSIDDLLAAKKAVVVLGGMERAMEAIQALRRLEG